jgi:hypothetical protein
MPLTISSTSKNADYRAQRIIEKTLSNGLFRVLDIQVDHVELIIPECPWLTNGPTNETITLAGVSVAVPAITLVRRTPDE